MCVCVIATSICLQSRVTPVTTRPQRSEALKLLLNYYFWLSTCDVSEKKNRQQQQLENNKRTCSEKNVFLLLSLFFYFSYLLLTFSLWFRANDNNNESTVLQRGVTGGAVGAGWRGRNSSPTWNRNIYVNEIFFFFFFARKSMKRRQAKHKMEFVGGRLTHRNVFRIPHSAWPSQRCFIFCLWIHL